MRSSYILLLLLCSLVACKARTPSAVVKEAPSDNGSTIDQGLDLIERNLATMEPVVANIVAAVGGAMAPLEDIGGFALADEPSARAKSLLEMAVQFGNVSDTDMRKDAKTLRYLAAEFASFASISEDRMTPEQVERLKAAAARAERLLKTFQQPYREKKQDSKTGGLVCKDNGSGSFLPTDEVTGKALGVHEAGKSEPIDKSNCEMALAGQRDGFVCSMFTANTKAPFNIKTGDAIGFLIGYQQLINCVRAVKESAGGEVCIVNNGLPGRTYTRFNLKTGYSGVAVFEDYDKCMAGDEKKAPETRIQCERRCADDYAACVGRDVSFDHSDPDFRQRITNLGLVLPRRGDPNEKKKFDNALNELKCSSAKFGCEQACPNR